MWSGGMGGRCGQGGWGWGRCGQGGWGGVGVVRGDGGRCGQGGWGWGGSNSCNRTRWYWNCSQTDLTFHALAVIYKSVVLNLKFISNTILLNSTESFVILQAANSAPCKQLQLPTLRGVRECRPLREVGPDWYDNTGGGCC